MKKIKKTSFSDSKDMNFFARFWAGRISYAFMLPFLVIFFTFTVLPVMVSIILSFTSFNMLEFPDFVGFENYTRLLFNDSVFITGVKNTLILAVILGPGGYVLSLILAWFINELTPVARAFVTLVFYIPSISGNAYMIWQIMFSSDDYGYINSLLTKIGVIQQPIIWLNDTRYMLGIVIAVSLWMSLGTGFLSFVAGFQGVNKSYYEAGAVDGIKNRWQELWFISLPLLRPQLMFGAVMSITGVFNVGPVITALCGYPTTDYAAHTVMNHLVDYGTTRFEMGYASSIATVLFIVSIAANVYIKRLISKVGE